MKNPFALHTLRAVHGSNILVSSILYVHTSQVSQTSFGHISINSSSILTVLMAMKSPWKDLLIDTSHILRQSVMDEILGRSTGNHYGTIY